MFIKTLALTATLALAAGTAGAEVIEVKMLNRGETGTMVFEPAFVVAQPGDTVKFLPTDRGHNVESIDGMLPDGVDSFKTKPNDEFSLTVDAEGLYGIKCTPHYGMGMVALIQVGDAVNLDAAKDVKQRGKSRGRFEDLFANVQ